MSGLACGNVLLPILTDDCKRYEKWCGNHTFFYTDTG